MNPANSNEITPLTPEENAIVFIYRLLRQANIKPLITRPGVLTGDQEAVLHLAGTLMATHADVFVLVPPQGSASMPKLVVRTPIADIELDISHHLAHRIQDQIPPPPLITSG